MVEVKPRDIRGHLKTIGTQMVGGKPVRAAVFYGPDAGMVREYAKMAGRQIAPDLGDPFSVVRPSPKDVADSPSLLADEMATISMLGGRRLVWLDGADRTSVGAVKLALSGHGDGFLLVTAGDVRKTDAVVKAFIGAPDALAFPCYGDEGQSLVELVNGTLSGAGLTATPEALSYLTSHLGADRMVSKQELEKLLLYMGTPAQNPDRQVTLLDARANIGDASAFNLQLIAQAVTAGQKVRLEEELERAWIAGENPVAVLRVMLQRMKNFHKVRGALESGVPAAEAVKRAGVFWKEAEAFTREVQRWSLPKIVRALEIVQEAEIGCKTTASPAQIVCARALLSLTKAA